MITLLEINWNLVDIIFLLIAASIGLVVTYLTIPYLITFMKKKGYIGIDIHKNARTEVAESGGLSMIFGFVPASILLMIFFPVISNDILVVLISVVIAGVIGYIDDRIRLKSRYKLLMTLFLGVFIYVTNILGFIHIRNPIIPILGQLRLNVLYPMLIPIIITIFANTVNMLEGYNGEGSGTCLIAAFFMIINSLIYNSLQGLVFSVITLAVIFPFFLFNKFPAKIFPGDVGTLAMGVMMASIALFGSLEAAVFCGLLVHIFNSFYYISSVRGFFESSEIHKLRDDIILLENDTIKASEQKDALLTMPRLILAKGPLTEPRLVKNILALSILAGFISVITTFLTAWTIGDINLIWLIIISLILFSTPTIFLLIKFPRIRIVLLEILILYIISVLYLVFTEVFIIPIPNEINLILVRIPINLLLAVIFLIPALIVWYILTIKIFWKVLNTNQDEKK